MSIKRYPKGLNIWMVTCPHLGTDFNTAIKCTYALSHLKRLYFKVLLSQICYLNFKNYSTLFCSITEDKNFRQLLG